MKKTIYTGRTGAASVPRLLSVKQVMERVSLSRATIYLKVKSGDFPIPKLHAILTQQLVP